MLSEAEIQELLRQNEKMREAIEAVMKSSEVLHADSDFPRWMDLCRQALALPTPPSLDLYQAKEKVIESANKLDECGFVDSTERRICLSNLRDAISLLAKVEKSSSQERK